MQRRFLPFLPNDESGTDAQSEAAVSYLSADLQWLLAQDDEQFWDTVLQEQSLQQALDSYLRFKRRSHDASGGVQGTSEAQQQLARRVFMVLLRMVSGSASGARGVPNASRRAQWLYEQRPLDLPKLMDVAVLYGSANPALTTQLIHQVFTTQPLLLDELGAIVEPLVSSLTQLQDRMTTNISRAVRGEAKSGRPLLDTLAYVRDLAVSCGCFIGSYPPAAALLLAPGHGSLLACVAGLHDRLLPGLLRGVGSAAAMQGTGVTCAEAGAQVQEAALALQRLAIQLVGFGYLMTPQQAVDAVTQLVGDAAVTAAAAGGSGSGAAGSSSSHASASTAYAAGSSAGPSGSSSRTAANGAGSSSWHSNSNTNDRGGGSWSGSRAYNAGASSSGAGSSGSSSRAAPQGAAGSSHSTGHTNQLPGRWDAETRGTQLMSALMNAAYMEGGGEGEGGGAGGGSLLHVLNGKYGLDVAVACAVQQSDLIIDDAQFDYMMALLDSHDRSRVDAAARARVAGPRAGPATSGAAAPAAPTPPPIDPAVLASLVSQLEDVLGDSYGPGYLHACLNAFKYNAEETLDRLLTGDLPESVRSLDVKLKTWQPPAPTPTQPSGSAGPSWSSAAVDAQTLRRTEAAAAAERAAKVTALQPAQGNRTQVHRGVARVLNRVDAETKAATRALAEELEYDDEYDDSMDDLVRTGADGVCDIEGDDVQTTNPPLGTMGTYQDEPDGYTHTSRPTNAPGKAQRAPLGPAGARGGGAAAGRGGRGAGRPTKHWVLDGRIYNYAKEGAQECSSREEADKAVQAAQEAAQAIYGLGAGGNKGAQGSRWEAVQQAGASSRGPALATAHQTPRPTDTNPRTRTGEVNAGDEDGDGQGAERSWGADRGRGGRIPRSGGRGAGGGRGEAGDGGRGGGPNYVRKEQNKAAVGNHHRKDRAMKKAGLM